MTEYKSAGDIEKSEQTPVVEAPTDEQNQQTLEQKLAEKGFFEYVTITAEHQGRTIDELIDQETPENMLKLAEEYETKVLPTIKELKIFFNEELIKKLSLIKGEKLKEANQSIEAFLSRQAIEEPAAFQKHSENLKAFKDNLDMAAQLESELQRYGRNQAEWEAKRETLAGYANQAEDLKDENEKNYRSAESKLEGQRSSTQSGVRNKVSSFINRIKSFGKDGRSNNEVALDQGLQSERVQYEAGQKSLDDKIDELKEHIDVINQGIVTKEAFDKSAENAENELLSALGPMKELRDVLLNAVKEEMQKTNYNARSTTETLGNVNEYWQNPSDGEDDLDFQNVKNEMMQNLDQTISKEITEQANSAEKSINPTKLQEFSKFLSQSVKNEEVRRIVLDCLDVQISIKKSSGNQSKLAHLGLMRKRADALTF